MIAPQRLLQLALLPGLALALSMSGSALAGTTETAPAGSTAGPSIPAGFPTAATTGVLPGTVLTPSGGMVIREDGVVVENVDIAGCLRVEANDVVIRNSRIRCGHSAPAVVVRGVDVVLQDVEIDGTGQALAGISGRGYTLLRGNVHSSIDGARFSTGTVIADSYFHDLHRVPEVSHNDVLQTLGVEGAVIRGNTLLAYDYETLQRNNSVMHLRSHDGRPVRDVLVEGNYMDGGGYTVNVGDVEQAGNLVFRANVFDAHFKWAPLRVKVKSAVEFDDSNVMRGSTVPASAAPRHADALRAAVDGLSSS